MTRDDQMTALLDEAHRLLAKHAAERIAYYTAPTTDHMLLAKSCASMRAVDLLIVARAMAIRLGKEPSEIVAEDLRKETDRLVREHLEDVLAKIEPSAQAA